MTTPRLMNAEPDGSGGFLERIEWKTLLSRSLNGTSYRDSVPRLPRYRYEYVVGAHASLPHGRSILDDVRAHAGEWLVPLWPHIYTPTETPAVRDLAGTRVARLASGVVVDATSSVPSGAVDLVPAAVCRLVDSGQIGHVTDSLALLRFAFQTTNYAEVIEPWNGPVGGDGYPIFNFDCDWSSGQDEEVTRESELLDFGLDWVESVRYIKRSHTLTVALLTPADMRRWRQFMHYCRGQYAPFWAQQPGDPAPALYYLGADTVETQYFRPGVAAISKIRIERLG